MILKKLKGNKPQASACTRQARPKLLFDNRPGRKKRVWKETFKETYIAMRERETNRYILKRWKLVLWRRRENIKKRLGRERGNVNPSILRRGASWCIVI